MKRLLGIIAASIIFLSLTAESNSCANKNNGGAVAPANNTAPAGNSGTTAPAASPGAAANVAQVGDLKLTVNAVSESYQDRIFPAEAGTHYVTVDITATNTGKKTYNLNLLNFHLKDSAGFANNPATTEGPSPRIGAHDMVPGQEVRGYLVFKLGDGRTPAELQYQSFTGTPGRIKLG